MISPEQPQQPACQTPIPRRYTIFSNKLFSGQQFYKKIPLHFQFTNNNHIVLDHRTNNNFKQKEDLSKQNSMNRKSIQHKNKIFQRRKCKSLRSGLLSINDSFEGRSTLQSSERIRKCKIFNSTLSVRDETTINIHQSMKDLVNLTHTQKIDNEVSIPNNRKTISFSYHSPPKNQVVTTYCPSYHQPCSQRLKQSIQPQRRSSPAHTPIDRYKTFDEPMHPKQFCNLVQRVSKQNRQKKKKVSAFVSYPCQQQKNFIPYTPQLFRPHPPVQQLESHIYRI